MEKPKHPRQPEDLPVFKQAWDVVVELHRTGENVARSFRYNELPAIKREAMEVVQCIRRAQMDRGERGGHIRAAIESLEFVRLYIRLMHDLKLISIKRFAVLARRVEGVSRQLHGWLKSVENPQLQNEA